MITIKKPSNFRDLGGIVTTDGRKIKEKCILRSGEPVGVADEVKELLVEEYRLKAIADFRTMKEVTKGPDDEIDGVQYHHIDILKSAEQDEPSLENLTAGAAQNAVDQMMQEVYRRMITDRHACEGYGMFIKLLEETEDGAVLFHCFAGKDRTGLGAAIVLELLGVSREEIMKDYMRTNELRKEENRMLLQMAEKGGMNEAGLAAMEVALTVKESYLEAAYEQAEQTYGSFAGYLVKAIGITEARQKKFREKFLAG